MGCCSDDDNSEPQLVFKPAKQRGCTDILCLLLFVAIWATIIALFISAANKGADATKTVRGSDWRGDICGKDGRARGYPLTVWPNPYYYDVRMCVQNCSATEIDSRMIYTYKSEAFLGMYCIPKSLLNFVNGTTSSLQFEGLSSFASLARLAMADLYVTWPVILGSIGIALVISSMYVCLTRKFAGCLVWGIIVLILAGGVMLSVGLLKYSRDAKDSDVNTERANTMLTLGIIAAVFTFIALVIVIFLRDKISDAVNVVKESSLAIWEIKTVVCFPILPLIFGGIFFFWWIVVTLYFFSVPDKADPVPMPTKFYKPVTGVDNSASWASENYTELVYDVKMQRTFALHFFYLLWNVQFLVYFTFIVIAGALAQWYFARDPATPDASPVRGDGPNQLSNSPVWDSVKRVFRYHLGTVACASAIIAVMQFIRACVKYIEEKTKSDPPNRLQKCVFCMIQCCLWCIQKFLDKISKNSLVWTSIYGESFCPSAAKSFSLILSNLTRVAALTLVSVYISFLGKLIVAFCTTGISILIMNRAYKDDMNSNAMPAAVIFLISYLVASLFMTVFETAIDTIFLCYLIDVSSSKGNQRLRAPQKIQDIVAQNLQKSEQIANSMKKQSTNEVHVENKPPPSTE